MSAVLDMLDEELADTLARARARRPQQTPRRQLARQIVGAPRRAPRAGTCIYCGAPAAADIVCAAHADLPYLDPAFAAVVTDNTTGPGRKPWVGERVRGPKESVDDHHR